MWGEHAQFERALLTVRSLQHDGYMGTVFNGIVDKTKWGKQGASKDFTRAGITHFREGVSSC